MPGCQRSSGYTGCVVFLAVVLAAVALILVVSGDTERETRRVVFRRPVATEDVATKQSAATTASDSTDAEILARELASGCDGDVTFTKVFGAWYMQAQGSGDAYRVDRLMPQLVIESLDRY